MDQTQDLIEKVERLRTLLVNRATGIAMMPEEVQEFVELRRELVANPRLRGHLPAFLTTCRTIPDFWSYIQPKLARYQERREFLVEQFGHVLTMLETDLSSPGDTSVAAVLAVVDSAHVHDAWRKAVDRRANDPDGAITTARSLVETVCKHILDSDGVPYDDKDELPNLYFKVAQVLGISPKQQQDDHYRRILGNCQAIVDNLAALRNRMGDAHGKGKDAEQPSALLAELAVNLAGTMATFLLATWEAKRKPAQ